jgi:hypothetical protein
MRYTAGVRLELWLLAAVLGAAMLLAMWAQRPLSTCTMPAEAARRLILTRDVDREHLARDHAEAKRVERRYTAATAGSPEQQSRLDACEATLVRQIETMHGVTADQVRRSPA